MPQHEHSRAYALAAMAIFAASLASVIFGIADFSGGYATKRTPVRQVVLFSQAVGFVWILIAAPIIGSELVRAEDMMWGAFAGFSGMAALLLFYKGLAHGKVSVVSPLAAITGIALPVAFGTIIGERASALAAFGIVLAFPAVWLISRADDDGDSELWRGGALHGLVAGCGFGGFFILISRSSDLSGMWPLVGARATTVLTMTVVLLASRALLPLPEKSQWWIIAVSGVADVAANLLFIVAVRDSLLILASVIISLYPVSTLILARIVLGERTVALQRVGLVLGLVAVVMIGAG